RDLIARRLRRDVRANDHLGFVGDDAYVVLLSLDTGEAEAYPAAQRLVCAATAAAGAPANAGVATCPDDGDEAEALIEKAGAAAVAAAAAGDAQPSWYRESDGRAYARRASIRDQLRDGDPGALLEARFQPILDANNGSLFGASAAASWRRVDPETAGSSPQAWLSAEPDRRVVENLELWMIARAAEAYDGSGSAPDLPVFISLESRSDAAVDAIARGFADRPGTRSVYVELVGRLQPEPPEIESFVRRLRSIGAAVGVGAWRTASAPFDGANGLLDFVTVDAGSDVRTLAGLAVASVIAPIVVAGGARDRDHARWLLRNGATAVRGDGIAPPMAWNELVRWASNHSGTVAQ
ncbi:MAG: EAL domain-containing protein, partial [Candidatus Elarobacter sp.]